jgi:hypothetical protein
MDAIQEQGAPSKSMAEIGRDKAIKHFMSGLGQQSEDEDAANRALNALAVAHVAARFGFVFRPRGPWQREKGVVLKWFTAAWEAYQTSGEDPKLRDELYMTLDFLTITHIAATFEWASGPIKR